MGVVLMGECSCEHKHKHGNGHDHCHCYDFLDKNRILAAFLLVFLTAGIEFAAGIWSGSLSLWADAAHMTGDALALGCSFWALSIAHRNERAEAYAGFINGIILIAMSGYILWSAHNRYLNPQKIYCDLMIIAAIGGLVINAIQLYVLRHVSRKNLATKAALYHVISDLISSLGVISAGLIIYLTAWYIIDPIIGIMISLLVFKYGCRFIKDSIKLIKNPH